jgi:hypothetical protein
VSLSFRNSSLPWRTSLIHRNAEARQSKAEPCTFRRRSTFFSPAYASNRRNSMTVRFLPLTSIGRFRFEQFGNHHRDSPCEVIIFGMRDLNVMHMKCLGMNQSEFHPARCGSSNCWLDTLYSGERKSRPMGSPAVS